MNKLLFLIVADDSPSSIRAIRYGYIMAHRARAKVALLGVVDEALGAGNVDAGLFPREALALLKKNMEEFLHKMAETYGGRINTEILTPVGDIKKTVLNMADELQADLIIAGTHGRKGLNRLLIGSVAESILRDSRIPVLVVPLGK